MDETKQEGGALEPASVEDTAAAPLPEGTQAEAQAKSDHEAAMREAAAAVMASQKLGATGPAQPVPSVGRVVHYYDRAIVDRLPNGKGINGAGEGPYLAFVTQVFPGLYGVDPEAPVNLYVIPAFGEPFHAGSVPLQGGRFDNSNRAFAWPTQVPPKRR